MSQSLLATVIQGTCPWKQVLVGVSWLEREGWLVLTKSTCDSLREEVKGTGWHDSPDMTP